MKDVAVIIAGAIIMLGSPLCLLAGASAGPFSLLFAGAHFIVGLWVILFGAITVRNKPKT